MSKKQGMILNKALISIRLDDICPTMNWKNFNAVIDICNRYNVKPLLGVVPDNKDKKLVVDEANKNFFDIIKKYQDDGFCIAQHGVDHVYTNKKGGILSLNKQSDIVGLSKEDQFKTLKRGKELLEGNGIKIATFMAPSHSYDNNTLLALKELGFKYVTDGYTNFNYNYQGLIFIPCMHTFKFTKKPKGIVTLCLHVNTMSEKNIAEFEKTLEENKNDLCSFSELCKQPTRKHFRLKQNWNLFIVKTKRIISKIIKRK